MPEHKDEESSLRKLEDALMHYARTMHDYTLELWANSRRRAEETLNKGAGDSKTQTAPRSKSRERKTAKESTGRDRART